MTQTACATNRTLVVPDGPRRLPRDEGDADVVCMSSDRSRDAQLMTLAVRDDRTAQERVVRRLLDRVQRLAFMFAGHRADARDASPTSIMAILQFASGFWGDTTLERWADRIVLTKAVRAVLDPAPPELAWGAPATDGASADPAAVVHEYLSRLTPNARAVLVLRELFEYSIDEIAHMTGVSPNVARERLLRAREAMRDVVCRDSLHSDGSTLVA